MALFNNAPLRSELSVPLNYQMTTTNGDMPVPPPPYELLGIISNSEWDERVRQILAHLARTTWSLWLRIYVTVGVLVSSLLPWPVIMFAQRAIIGSSADDGLSAPFVADGTRNEFLLDEDYAKRVMHARIASGGILLGIILLVWAPLLGYLAFQSHRLNALLSSMTASDSLKGSHQSLRWSLGRSRFLSRTGTLLIGIPEKLRRANLGSNYHPEAYLPPYVSRASYDRAPSEKSGHARRRSNGSIASLGSQTSSNGTFGRQHPAQRQRFDYAAQNMYGAPPMPAFGGRMATGRV